MSQYRSKQEQDEVSFFLLAVDGDKGTDLPVEIFNDG